MATGVGRAVDGDLARAGQPASARSVRAALTMLASLPSADARGRYFMPQSGAEVRESALGESHAWFEFWDGSWAALDPTNGTTVGTEHVVVARGREYEDVPPLKGVYSGGGRGVDATTLEVSVDVTRLA